MGCSSSKSGSVNALSLCLDLKERTDMEAVHIKSAAKKHEYMLPSIRRSDTVNSFVNNKEFDSHIGEGESGNEVPEEANYEVKTVDQGQQDYLQHIRKKRENIYTIEQARTIIFHGAVLSGDITAVKELIHLGANPNAMDHLGNRAIHLAAANGDTDMACFLLCIGAIVNVGNIIGWSALHYAVLAGSIGVTEALLLHGAWATFKDNTNTTPLHVLCTRSGEYEIFDRLIALLIAHSNSVCLEAEDKLKQTPLHIAANSGNVAATQILLARGARVNFTGGAESVIRNMELRNVPRPVQQDILSILTPDGR